jgi:hypothetical protein
VVACGPTKTHRTARVFVLLFPPTQTRLTSHGVKEVSYPRLFRRHRDLERCEVVGGFDFVRLAL